ncbi:MAG: ABC transporter permease [Chloroflexota bacterium]
MWRSLIQYLLQGVFTIWLALTLAFIGLRLLSGSAISAQLQGSGLPPSVIEERLNAVGYNQPIHLQYVTYIGEILSGNWGQSLYSGQTVWEAISTRLDDTLELALGSLFLAIILGLMLGLLAALTTPLQNLARFIIDLSLGIPIYVTATLLLFIVAVHIGGIQRGLLLPVITLGFHTSGAIARVLESSLEQTKQSNFIRTAYAKGLSSPQVIQRHMLRLAILPVVSVIGLQAGILFSGTVITETIFGRAGLGLLLLDATLERDYPIVQGIVTLVAIIYIVINRLIDILILWLDPRRSAL